MELEKYYREELRDEFVDAHKRSTGNNLLELSRYAKEEYYRLLREDMCIFLNEKEGSRIFSAVLFRNFIFWLHILNFSRSTIDTIKAYNKAVQLKFPKQDSVNDESRLIPFNNINSDFLDDKTNLRKISKEDEQHFIEKSVVAPNPYVISFVLSKTAYVENEVYLEIFSQFKSIVRNDQKLIYEANEGLAKALYYFACLHREYDIYIPWEAFLEIADFYNGDTQISSRLIDFPQYDPICETLSSYITLEKLVHPAHLNNYVFYFRDDIIVAEGLKEPFCKEWRFDETVKMEIATILLRTYPLAAYDLFSIIRKEGILSVNLEKEFKEAVTRSFLVDLIINRHIKYLYDNAGNIDDDDYWKDKNLFLACGLVSHWNDYYKMVLEKLISLGCKSEMIMRQSKMRRSKLFNDLHDLSLRYDFKQYGYRDYKNLILDNKPFPLYRL